LLRPFGDRAPLLCRAVCDRRHRMGATSWDADEEAEPARLVDSCDRAARGAHLQSGVPAARRGARRAAVGSSLPWALAERSVFPAFIAVSATVAGGAWPS